MVKTYSPERGDIILINFSPQAGREQAGKRPALVLSPQAYNEKVGLALMCPITRQIKRYPFEVELPTNIKTKGVILSDHIKNLDWQSRNAEFIEKLPKEVLEDVLAKLNTLLT